LLSADGTSADYASLVGGLGEDGLYGVGFDAAGGLYAAGFTGGELSGFPTLTGYQPNPADPEDAFLFKMLPATPPPGLTHLSDDPGASATDAVTNDQTLTISGTAKPSAVVKLTRVGVGLIGTTTADSSGDWSIDYSGTALPEGVHGFTATAAAPGFATSRPSG